MWVHSKIGFFSAVADYYRPGHMVVRARFESDIRALCKLIGDTEAEPRIRPAPSSLTA